MTVICIDQLIQFIQQKDKEREREKKNYRQLKFNLLGYECVRVISSFFFCCTSTGKQFQNRIVSSADRLTIGFPFGPIINERIRDVWPRGRDPENKGRSVEKHRYREEYVLSPSRDNAKYEYDCEDGPGQWQVVYNRWTKQSMKSRSERRSMLVTDRTHAHLRIRLNNLLTGTIAIIPKSNISIGMSSTSD